MQFALLMISVSALGSGSPEVSRVIQETDQQVYLQYDDDSPSWLTWTGLYRGVWFNTDDWLPGQPFNWIDFSEYWMYHDVSYPWDVSDFISEIRHGYSSGPLTLIDSDQITAIHYAPVYGNFNKNGDLSDFWAIDVSSLSSGGWPSLIGDETPPSVDHSFYSDDFITWIPWSDGIWTGDYLIRAQVHYEYNPALERMTWGSLKAAF
jgi:hypothetical protein